MNYLYLTIDVLFWFLFTWHQLFWKEPVQNDRISSFSVWRSWCGLWMRTKIALISWTLQLRSLQIKIGFASPNLHPPTPKRSWLSRCHFKSPCTKKITGQSAVSSWSAHLFVFSFFFFSLSFRPVPLPKSSGGFTSRPSLAGQKRPVERFNEASFLGYLKSSSPLLHH